MFSVWIKNYWMYLLAFLVFLILSIYSFSSYWAQENRNLEQNLINYEKYCYEGSELLDYPVCDYETISKKPSFFYSLIMTFNSDIFPKGFTLVMLVIIPVCYFLTRYFNSGIIFNELTRKPYSKIKHGLILKSYANIFPFIICMALIFLGTSLFTDLTTILNPDPLFDKEYLSLSSELDNPIFFIVWYFVTNILYALVYINITLFVNRKYHNFFIATIISFVTIVGIELFLELGVDLLFVTTILKLDFGVSFNILNGITFNAAAGLGGVLAFAITMFVLTYLLVYFGYRNKEKIIMDCEEL